MADEPLFAELDDPALDDPVAGAPDDALAEEDEVAEESEEPD